VRGGGAQKTRRFFSFTRRSIQIRRIERRRKMNFLNMISQKGNFIQIWIFNGLKKLQKTIKKNLQRR
jgi:hypothetical protein